MNESRLLKSDLNADYACIGTGPLLLAGTYSSPLASALSHEIVLLVPSSRPGGDGSNTNHLLLGLKNSQEQLNISNGEIVNLECQFSKDTNPHQFQFSSKPAQIWLKPVILDHSSILIEAGGTEMDKCEFVLKTNSERIQVAAQQSPFYTSLKRAKWWGQDVLFQLYGGKEYQSLKDKQKIEIIQNVSGAICYVSQGDYLTFENRLWKVTDLPNASLSSPLAYVKEISAGQLKLTLWDENGFAFDEITLKLEGRPKVAPQNELFSSIHFRTASQVTCLLGKRRVILKCGDWLLKTAHGWRNLKKLSEIEAYLAHQLKGELFVFDSIEKKEDKCFVKGHLIDEMRSSAFSISLPVIQEKKVKPSKKKKKSEL
ncbi:MAG TPA: hypothetical protein VLG76_06200 [Rhabdochlamydiaceae bacterium]|nr:hypothetical protein [Rhabdochlamydiaceae bacterium]